MAISRAYRMGQARNVLVYRLLCKDTVDERITDLLKEKQAAFDAFADKSSAAAAAAAEENIEVSSQGFGKIIEEEIERIKAKHPESVGDAYGRNNRVSNAGGEVVSSGTNARDVGVGRSTSNDGAKNDAADSPSKGVRGAKHFSQSNKSDRYVARATEEPPMTNQKDTTIPKPISAVQPNSFCIKCGRKLPDGALFCPDCGQPRSQ